MRRILAKLAALFRRKSTEAELSREVAAHLTLLEDDFRSQGLSEEEARLAARRSYGNVELTKELHRDEWRFAWFEALGQDLRAAWRSLRKSPGFAATAIVSLALGIGANTAIFTMVNGVLLKKLPVADPERIVQVKANFTSGTGPDEMLAFGFPQFEELRGQQTVFEDLVGVIPMGATLELDGEQPPLKLDLVTGSYFSFFDKKAVLGRLVEPSDDTDGSELVCVLAYSAWQRLFRGDAAIVGQTVEINTLPMRVVGVAPPGFIGTNLQQQTDVWAPLVAFSSLTPFGAQFKAGSLVFMRLLGRMPEGASLDASSAWLQDASPQIEEALPPRRVERVAVYSLQDGSAGLGESRGELSSPLWILMGAVTLVLLIACANLANLLLSRMNDRTREFAIKLSVGVGRWRLVRQLFVETLLVVFVGGVAALAVASGLTRFVLAVYNEGARARQLELLPDHAVLLYAAGACLLTALVAGLYPAWRASRTGFGLVPATKSERGLNRNWARRSLIVAQVALAVVLLFGSVLFAHSLRNLTTLDLGYSAERILTLQLARVDPRAGAKDNEPLELAELLERTRELPNVESAAYASIGVLEGNMAMTRFEVRRPDGEALTVNNVYALNVAPGYFETLQTPLLRGREFNMSDWRDGPPVAIVNESLANKAWPGQDPLGRKIGKDAEVVGLVVDSKYAKVREDALPIVYWAFKKFARQGVMQVRFRGSATALESEVRQLMLATAPDFEVSNAATIEALRDRGISQDRLLAFLSLLFGLLGVGLALVGIYALITYAVTQRTHEIGVRVSVGAQRSQIVRLVLSEATALVLLGIVVGVPLALTLSRWLESLLYEVAPWDPLYVALTLGILLLGGMVAAYLPALRATRINPLEALKCD
ncbi:MAG: ABC transporter permease [Acidobacteria bacterium]|nr:ABC transporter permease [Acidobacteriota bacterium]MDA1235743.1 ABC transporter permease [Acidobacteriota bacterium]